MEYFAATNKKPSSKRPVGANTFAPPPRAPHPDHLPQKLRAQPRSDAHLRSAAAAGRVDELRSLIAVRGDVNATSGTGATACFLAAARGQHASLATLLEHGADATIAKPSGATALHAAAAAGHAACVQMLIHAGCKVDRALRISCGKGHAEVTRLLLQAGADVAPAAGPTPLAAALAAGALDCVRLCIDANADVERVGDSGLSPLAVAARAGNSACARLLLEAGAEVNRATADGQTALHAACEAGHVETVALLIAANASLDQKRGTGGTALTIASRYCHGDVVSLLLARGAGIEQLQKEAVLEHRAIVAEASQAEAEQALAAATTSEEAMRRALNAMQLRLVEESEARFRAERLWRYHASRG